MANITINDTIKYNVSPNRNIDYYYGPYESIEEALESLVDSIDDFGDPVYIRYIGLTIGIKQQDGSIKEYWFKSGITDEDLVEKAITIDDLNDHTTIQDFFDDPDHAPITEIDDTVTGPITSGTIGELITGAFNESLGDGESSDGNTTIVITGHTVNNTFNPDGSNKPNIAINFGSNSGSREEQFPTLSINPEFRGDGDSSGDPINPFDKDHEKPIKPTIGDTLDENGNVVIPTIGDVVGMVGKLVAGGRNRKMVAFIPNDEKQGDPRSDDKSREAKGETVLSREDEAQVVLTAAAVREFVTDTIELYLDPIKRQLQGV